MTRKELRRRLAARPGATSEIFARRSVVNRHFIARFSGDHTMILTRSKGFPHGGTHSLPVARRQARCFLKLAMFQKSRTGTRQSIHTATCAIILVAAAMVRAGLGAESPELLAWSGH